MHEKATTSCVGIDISKDYLDACHVHGNGHRRRRFPNDRKGHERLIGWIGENSARVCVEASGRYSLDVALALCQADKLEVMVANPRAIKNFREASMRRSKTDAVDAKVIAEYAQRMPFNAWEPPEEANRELRAITRRIQALTKQRAAEKNRLHAVEASRSASAVVANDIEVNMRHLTRRIDELLRQAVNIVREAAELQEAYSHLVSIPGVGRKSAILLLGELVLLPDDMSVREWVAHAGLDPKHHTSGTSVEHQPRISKMGNPRIRRALYMPAVTAARHEPHVRAFYQKLIARGKAPLVALVAVMRKLLHSIYGMLKHDQDFDGQKFYQLPRKPVTIA